METSKLKLMPEQLSSVFEQQEQMAEMAKTLASERSATFPKELYIKLTKEMRDIGFHMRRWDKLTTPQRKALNVYYSTNSDFHTLFRMIVRNWNSSLGRAPSGHSNANAHRMIQSLWDSTMTLYDIQQKEKTPSPTGADVTEL